MILFYLINTLLVIVLALSIGYWLGKRNSYLSKRGKPLSLEEISSKYDNVANLKIKDLIGKKEDEAAISDEPAGIIYRPSPAELKKMNEDKTTKEAKEAIAETLSQEEPPII